MIVLLNYFVIFIVFGFGFFIVRAVDTKKYKQAGILTLVMLFTLFFANTFMNSYGYRNSAPDKTYGAYSQVGRESNTYGYSDPDGFQSTPVERPAPVIQDLTSRSASPEATQERAQAFKSKTEWDKSAIKELATQPRTDGSEVIKQ